MSKASQGASLKVLKIATEKSKKKASLEAGDICFLP